MCSSPSHGQFFLIKHVKHLQLNLWLRPDSGPGPRIGWHDVCIRHLFKAGDNFGPFFWVPRVPPNPRWVGVGRTRHFSAPPDPLSPGRGEGGCPTSPNSSPPVVGKVGAGPPPPGSLCEPLLPGLRKKPGVNQREELPAPQFLNPGAAETYSAQTHVIHVKRPVIYGLSVVMRRSVWGNQWNHRHSPILGGAV